VDMSGRGFRPATGMGFPGARVPSGPPCQSLRRQGGSTCRTTRTLIERVEADKTLRALWLSRPSEVSRRIDVLARLAEFAESELPSRATKPDPADPRRSVAVIIARIRPRSKAMKSRRRPNNPSRPRRSRPRKRGRPPRRGASAKAAHAPGRQAK